MNQIWTKENTQYLIDNSNTMYSRDIANHIGCSKSSVDYKIRKLNLPRKNLYIDITGQKFGKLTAIKNTLTKYGTSYIWQFKCECGNYVNYPISSVRRKSLKSKKNDCGCISRLGRSFKGYGYVSHTLYTQIKKNAEIRNLSFNLSIKYLNELFIKQQQRCVLTGLPITIKKHNVSRTTTASLDRIDSKKPYTKDNVQWIHKDINRMKWAFNQELFYKYCNLVCQHNNCKISKSIDDVNEMNFDFME